ncbi:STM3941 family protein [Dactylosporangium siamense]|uniref:Uncharacterized protein n=1 Tax=Dactylosporangium siamense TaxID=685454 RepID=A0A919U647_9ACTN|nr:STM3941 family protein [Dactylosporangium siamense]GIG44049.1 hypothetical protein Dsi01nite_020900 [Dactylosporangium siamense]
MDEALVIRPRAGRMLLTVLGAALFTAAGIGMLWTGDPFTMLAGALSVAFFGGGTVAVLARGLRHGMSQVTLTPTGMRLHSGGTVAWTDIAAVGCTRPPGPLVWIRLRDPEHYLASTPAHANRAMRRFMRPFAAILSVPLIAALPPDQHRTMWRYAGRAHSHADELRWNRETFGWDLALAVTWLDRSGEEFVELIERYRHS